jgi:type III secretion protein Q
MSETETQFRQDHLPVATVLSPQEQRGLTIRVATPPDIRISARRAALRRTVGQGLRIFLPNIDATLAIHLTTDEQRAAWPGALTLSGPDGALEIEEGARLLRILTGIDIDVADGSDDGHADWLLSAVLGRLAGTPFSSCDRITKKAPPMSKDTEVLQLVLRSERHLVSTHLRADAATFASILARTDWSQTRQPLSAYAALPMQINVEIGSHVLSASRLHSLAAGDILLPESTSFNAAGEGWLPFGQLSIHARYSAPGTLSILDVVRPPHAEREPGGDGGSTRSPHDLTNISKGEKMEEQHDEGEQHQEQAHVGDRKPAAEKADADAPPEAGEKTADDSNELDAVGIKIHFVLGRVKMTLGEIRTLTAGSIVQFAGGSPESVAIVSSGRTLGRGEVVDVDGRLGVRITQWGNEGE